MSLDSNSAYLVSPMMQGWKHRANHDLWEALDRETARHAIRFVKVPGHSGVLLIEEADRIATREARARSRPTGKKGDP